MRRIGGRRLSLFLATLAIGGTAVAASAAPEPSHLPLLSHFGVTPSKILRTKPTPVRMALAGQHRSEEGIPLGPLRSLRFEGDRHLALDLEGVPTCERSGRDVRRDLVEMERICGDAAIGRGRLTIEAFFPGDRWIPFSSDMTLYNLGADDRGPELLAFAYFPAPVVTALEIPVEVRPLDRGPFGWEARASVPKIFGGYGLITDYSLRIGRRFLSATCVGGKLELRVVAGFYDRRRLGERSIRPCAVAEADVRK